MDNKTMIISAFPGCGKTYISENQEDIGISVLDSDSSKFEKAEGWEERYANNIIGNIGKYDFIMVAQYHEVLEILNERGIPFIVVAPDNSPYLSERERQLIKNQWFGRFVLRDNSHIKDLPSWLNKLSLNYDEWTNPDKLYKSNPVSVFPLRENQYLYDIITDLNFKRLNCSIYTSRKEKNTKVE